MSHNFRGKIRTRAQRRKKWSQDATRNPHILYDQHGRQWSCSLEQKSGYPTGLISPLFQSPWRPPQNPAFFVINPDNISELYLDYGAMFAEAKASNATFHKRAVRAASKKGWPMPIRGQYTDDVIDALGAPPAPVEPIVAAYQGNRYILGQCDGCSRYSNDCVCAAGFKPPKPDPRLLEFVQRRNAELDEVTEGLDFSEASRQKALRDSGLKEVFKDGKRVLRDIEASELDGMDFSGPAPEPDLGASEMPGDSVGGVAAADIGPGGYEAVTIEEAQTSALEGMEELDAVADDDSDLTKEVEALEEDLEAAGVGAGTVPPARQEMAERQAPRRSTQTATRTRQGAHRSRVGQPGQKRSERPPIHGEGTLRSLRNPKKDKRPSMADGARPVIGDGVHDEEE